ncbi:hypothetical protein IAT40_006497 [Kwoniella sp. CBS 6097]
MEDQTTAAVSGTDADQAAPTTNASGPSALFGEGLGLTSEPENPTNINSEGDSQGTVLLSIPTSGQHSGLQPREGSAPEFDHFGLMDSKAQIVSLPDDIESLLTEHMADCSSEASHLIAEHLMMGEEHGSDTDKGASREAPSDDRLQLLKKFAHCAMKIRHQMTTFAQSNIRPDQEGQPSRFDTDQLKASLAQRERQMIGNLRTTVDPFVHYYSPWTCAKVSQLVREGTGLMAKSRHILEQVLRSGDDRTEHFRDFTKERLAWSTAYNKTAALIGCTRNITPDPKHSLHADSSKLVAITKHLNHATTVMEHVLDLQKGIDRSEPQKDETRGSYTCQFVPSRLGPSHSTLYDLGKRTQEWNKHIIKFGHTFQDEAIADTGNPEFPSGPSAQALAGIDTCLQFFSQMASQNAVLKERLIQFPPQTRDEYQSTLQETRDLYERYVDATLKEYTFTQLTQAYAKSQRPDVTTLLDRAANASDAEHYRLSELNADLRRRGVHKGSGASGSETRPVSTSQPGRREDPADKGKARATEGDQLSGASPRASTDSQEQLVQGASSANMTEGTATGRHAQTSDTSNMMRHDPFATSVGREVAEDLSRVRPLVRLIVRSGLADDPLKQAISRFDDTNTAVRRERTEYARLSGGMSETSNVAPAPVPSATEDAHEMFDDDFDFMRVNPMNQEIARGEARYRADIERQRIQLENSR